MLRKYVISTNAEDMENLPFYSWNCLTLQMDHRDVDLVIRNDNDMEKILKFLIYSLKTLDGAKDSAKKLIEQVKLLK